MRNLIAIGVGAILLVACIPSVYSFYQDKDVVFDPRLVGEWQEKGKTNNAEIWAFEPSTNKAFDLTITGQGKTGKIRAHLFKLKDQQFLDVIPARFDYAPDQVDAVMFSMFPGHMLIRVGQIEPELKIAFCDYYWLGKYLQTNSVAIRHHVEDERIVLTADTDDLQKFILNHLGTNELFTEYAVMVRRTKQ